MLVDHRTRLRKIHRALGIPADYARQRGLKLQREARSLVIAGRNPDGRVVKLTSRASEAWKQMRAAAAGDGVVLLPVSGFRRVARQTKIIREKLASGQTPAAVLLLMAAPGYSEHHTGRALDLGTPGESLLAESFAKTAAFHWLKRHAHRHGFYLSYPRKNSGGFAYEPWHWFHC